uniref:TUBB2 n=1 Tax=Arundo donax TaxID=35708 RepID=A0A0A9A9N5_ARUDO
MFFESHICWVSSGTVRERYCCDPREVSGAKPTMKKWSRGKGIRFTASLRRSEFSCPGKRRQQVTPLMVALIRWFRSPTANKTKINVSKCNTV